MFFRKTFILFFVFLLPYTNALWKWENATGGNVDDILSLIVMGDPQFYFMCELDNVQCKHISKRCRVQYSLPISLEAAADEVFNATQKLGASVCIKMESRFANRVQREAMLRLVGEMDHKPAALVIDGDLTQFGHFDELATFKSHWYTDFPVPLLLGLGNHDYQNNVNDCAFNFCAHTMLSWYVDYVQNKSIQTDVRREVFNGLEVVYTGSLAYTERVCSTSRKNCAYLIQMNNALDYKTEFSSLFVRWNLSSPYEYVEKELDILKGTNLPILLNMHKCENIQSHKLKAVLDKFMRTIKSESEARNEIPKVGVFFAHMHQRHEVHLHCIHGVKVPFVYVGSVPNNRFSLIKINGTHATITGYKAKDNLMHKGDTIEHLGEYNLWGKCSFNEHYVFADKSTRQRWQHFQNTKRHSRSLDIEQNGEDCDLNL
ncbi:unnamed protein product [Caenorhabditis angaria]|uniref:Calcineurin-like phosphoesterase domain-containing protein n=1 Tax=Caenorhabditis angaria TaxID=860376 RepID=A0A9P1NBT0_9PELO|nr:unnamed protein product [Caenorhabditis angaria]